MEIFIAVLLILIAYTTGWLVGYFTCSLNMKIKQLRTRGNTKN